MLGGGLALGGAAFAGRAAADPAQKSETDLTGTTFFNPCTGEDMVVTRGSLQTITHVHQPDPCVIHGTVHMNFKGVKAVGDPSGRNYQINLSQNISVQASDACDGQATQTGVSTATVTSQGPADNWKIDIRLHLTVNANGDTVVDRFEASQECR